MILTVTLNASVDKCYVVDQLHPYEVMRVKNVCNTAGGKGLNVSRVAALAGEAVTAMGFVGGYNGRLFESLIGEDGIEPHFTRIESETRCCINVCDEKSNRSTEFLEPGNPVTGVDLEAFLRDYEKRLETADVVVISGSMPKGVPVRFYGTLIGLARREGKAVFLDTSGEALRLSLPVCPSFVKPNRDEIRRLFEMADDSETALIDAVIKLHENGVETAAVSLGKDGVLVAGADGVYHGEPPVLAAVNTVGCGDSMVAGFAVGYVRGLSPVEQIRYAVAVSAANALTRETGYFRQEDLETLLPRVRVEKIG